MALTLVVALAGGRGPAPAQAQEVQREMSGSNQRESPQAGVVGQAPISFVDSPSAYCYQPDARQDTCFVDFSYLNVSASTSQYMTFLKVTLDQKVVLYDSGFFQTSMYLPGDALGQGFRVGCGPPGGGGSPDLGNAYAYKVDAKDTGNLTSANYGTAYCPPFFSANAAPVISVSPASLTSDQAPDAAVQLPLAIRNDAAFELPWTVTPTGAACAGSGPPWVTIGNDPGVTGAMETTDVSVTFSSTGLSPAIYGGHLCVTSGDTVTPVIDVPLTLKVHNAAYPACYASSVVSISNQDVATTTTREACLEIDAGPTVRVLGSGQLTLRAGRKVVLRNGFQVQGGGRLTAVLDPALATP